MKRLEVHMMQALQCARQLEAKADGLEHSYTAPLLEFVTMSPCAPKNYARTLPEDWPFWCKPDYAAVETEMKADPRRDAWVRKTQE